MISLSRTISGARKVEVFCELRDRFEEQTILGHWVVGSNLEHTLHDLPDRMVDTGLLQLEHLKVL
jgi:hypothetical protein